MRSYSGCCIVLFHLDGNSRCCYFYRSAEMCQKRKKKYQKALNGAKEEVQYKVMEIQYCQVLQNEVLNVSQLLTRYPKKIDVVKYIYMPRVPIGYLSLTFAHLEEESCFLRRDLQHIVLSLLRRVLDMAYIYAIRTVNGQMKFFQICRFSIKNVMTDHN